MSQSVLVTDPYTNTSPELTINQLLIIAMVSYLLFIITASLGIWLANNVNDWSSAGNEQAVKGVLITLLVLAIIMPVIYLLFRFKSQIIKGVNAIKK